MRLVPAELHQLDAALAGDEALARALGHDVVTGWATFTQALKPTRDALAASPDGAAWGARFFVTDDPLVLQKAGFGSDGEAEEDGKVVWRFSLARPPHP